MSDKTGLKKKFEKKVHRLKQRAFNTTQNKFKFSAALPFLNVHNETQAQKTSDKIFSKNENLLDRNCKEMELPLPPCRRAPVAVADRKDRRER